MATNVVYYYYAVYIARVRSDTGVLKPLPPAISRLSRFYLSRITNLLTYLLRAGHVGGSHGSPIGGHGGSRSPPPASVCWRWSGRRSCPALGCGRYPRTRPNPDFGFLGALDALIRNFGGRLYILVHISAQYTTILYAYARKTRPSPHIRRIYRAEIPCR